MTSELKIGLVGACGAGKTTISTQLIKLGYNARHIAQEHSYVPYMWQRITNPDILIFLEVSYENTILRRKLNWTKAEYQEQLRRLEHAHQHAHLVIDTDILTSEEVIQRILAFLHKNNTN